MGRWAKVPEALLDDEQISAMAVRVYAMISRYQGGKAASYASRDSISARLGVSEATVKRAMQELVDAGWITRVRRGGNTWETTVNDEPRRVTGDPRGGSQVTRTAGHARPAAPEAAGHPCTPGGSAMHPRRVTDDPPKEGTKLDETNSMSHSVARSAATTQKPTLIVVETEAPVLVDVEPIGPDEGRIVQALVAAYAEAWREAAGVYPPDRKCGAVGKNVRPLVAEGWDPPVLLLAVQRAGAARNLDIDGQLGNARAAYDRGGTSRRALFDAWDTRLATLAAKGM